MHTQERFHRELLVDLTRNGAWTFAFSATGRWIGFRLDMVAAVTMLSAALISVAARKNVSDTKTHTRTHTQRHTHSHTHTQLLSFAHPLALSCPPLSRLFAIRCYGTGRLPAYPFSALADVLSMYHTITPIPALG